MIALLADVVLFDLDGTLVDTAPDLCAAANAVRHGMRRPPVALDRIRPAVSRGSRAMLAAALPDLDESAREALVPEFLAHYARDIARLSRLFEGVDRVLAAIEAQQRPWGIVTNKPESLARQLLDSMNLAARCAVLIGGDTLGRRKPDPLPLLEACRRLGCDPHRGVYIGDDARDIEAAAAAGMQGVAAAWGYRDPSERIEDWGADHVVDLPLGLLRPGVMSSRADTARV